MRIALAQINPSVGDLEGNAALIRSRIAGAAAAGADIVVLPELAICGYPPEDLILKDHFVADCQEALLTVAPACRNIVALVGVPLAGNGAVYNAAAVLTEGTVAGWYRKILLPNCAVFDEKRYFCSGGMVTVLEMGKARVGITIDEDIWVAEGPALAEATGGGAGVVLNLSMSPYHHGKGRQREEMLAERARAAGAWVCYANGVGGQDELVFDGHSVVFDPEGELQARGLQFEEDLLLVDIDPPRRQPAETCPWPVEVIALGPPSTQTPYAAVGVVPGPPEVAPVPRRIEQTLGPEAEVYKALCLGLRDYALKNGFKQVVIGLSGGIDSALAACIAADALGPQRVNTVSMPSRYSSAGTKSDAKETAERLGVRYYEIPIERMFETYLDSLAPYLEAGGAAEGAGSPGDVAAAPGAGASAASAVGITEQNIQARIRSNLLMAFSNLYGWLVLATGNKSETAVGYTTLYGDMAGGFAVLKDVPKTLVYRLVDYRNKLGPGEGPVPKSTVTRAPSAELAPDQTDQDTLPPYDVLDRLIEAYVVNDNSIEEIVALGIEEAVVRRVVRMINLSEYKRRQAAPGVRISPKGFGKDRRLPITNRYGS